MKNFFYHILISLITSVAILASEQIDIKLSVQECLPGDLVELTAVSSTPTYQEFTLSIPAHKNLQLVAQETGPVTLEHKQFSQTSHWVFQTVAPESVTLDNITATFSGSQQSIPLAPLSLVVGTYPSLDSENTPAEFPEAIQASQQLPLAWLLVPIVLIMAVVFFSKSRKATPPEEPNTSLSIDHLKTELGNDKLPEQLCYALLDRGALTEPQKKLIERALYQPSFTAQHLLDSLNKEADA